MHVSGPDGAAGLWRKGTWITAPHGPLQQARPTVLVVGEGLLAGRVLRRCRADRRVVVAASRAPSAAAAEVIADARPDYALLCGAVDDLILSEVTSELRRADDPPSTVLALVALVGGRIRALPLCEVAPYEEAMLDELAGGRLSIT
jgi:hypothetical protein